jgi:hypothetical protein
MDEYEYRLEKKLENYRERRDKLEAELEKKFDAGKHRELNIIKHHITVCEQRLNGFWIGDETYTINKLD